MHSAILTLIITLSCSSIYAQEISKKVDKFKIEKNTIEVTFFDPFVNILDKNPEFNSKTDKEKSELLDSYLHNSTLYNFKLTNKETKEVTNYKIVGNPEITRSKMFYKVDIYQNQTLVETIGKVNCGGTLFEHMSIFDNRSRKKHIGNGVQLFGYFRRVQPYKEIKNSLTAIIKTNQDN